MKEFEGIISILGSIVAMATAILGIERGIYNLRQRYKGQGDSRAEYIKKSKSKKKKSTKKKKRKK